MLVIFGYLVVIATVFGGFVLSGGNLLALFQPLELFLCHPDGDAFAVVPQFPSGKRLFALMAHG